MSQINTHYSKQVGGLFYNLVHITTEAQKREWSTYSKTAGYVHGTNGITIFQRCLNFFDNPDTEVWVAFVSNKPVEDFGAIDKSGLEMYMSVTTSLHTPFAAHLGIQRVPCENPHKNISVSLHEFCANIMLTIHPEKQLMINSPEEVMRDILFKAFKAKGKGDAVQIYDSKESPQKITSECLEEERAAIKEAQRMGKMYYPTAIQDLHLKEDLFAQREKIESGEFFPCIDYDSKSELVTISDSHTGDEVGSLNNDNPEFNWFFKNHDFYRVGFGSDETPMIAVDLLALATLSDQFSHDE